MSNSHMKSLKTAALVVMSSIIISRLTGFIRVILIPAKLGVNNISDAYNIAFLVPDLMYTMLAGGAISAALIPIMSEHIEKKKEQDGWKIVGTFINVLFIAMAISCVIGMIFAPELIRLVTSGYGARTPTDMALTVKLTRILFPSVAFLMLAGVSNGILNSYQRFAASAYGPCVYNILCSISIFMFGNKTPLGVTKVAYGVMISAFLYFLFQLSFAIKHFKHYKFKILLKDPGCIRLFKLAIPSLISSSIVQVNLIISSRFATNFASGSVTSLNMANTLWQMPYGVFAMGMGIAILPTLSTNIAAGDNSNFIRTLNKSFKTVLLLIIPSAIGFLVLNYDIIKAVFQWTRGFNESNVLIAGNILSYFTLGLISQSIVAISNRAFYSVNDTKTPLYIGASTIVLNILLCNVFYIYTNLNVCGMALSYSISSALNAILGLIILNKKIKGINLSRLIFEIVKLTCVASIMGVILYFMHNLIPIHSHSKVIQLIYLFFEISVGSAAYFVILYLIRDEDVKYILNSGISKIINRLKN